MLNRTLKVLLLLLAFLVCSSTAQDPETEKRKKVKKNPHNVTDTTTYTVSREPDSLLLEQRAINLKLDSILLEKTNKK